MIRIPDYPITQILSALYQAPYTTTSANLSGEEPAYSVEELEQTLLHPDTLTVVPDLILDAGPIPKTPPSTIVDLTDWPPKVLRQGAQEFIWPR